MLILPAVVAAIVTAALIPLLDRWARASQVLLDVPNDRSSHRVPIPRVGGAAIVIGVAAGLAAGGLTGAPAAARADVLAAGALAIAAVSFLDDVRSIPALVRLIGHAVVGGIVVIAVGPWPVDARLDGGSLVSVAFAGLWIVGMINAYNFMDGIDGLAGGQAVVAGAGWAIVGALTRAPEVVALALAVAAAGAAFLAFNWQPARVFMGDTGSAFLGYAFAVLPMAAAPSAAAFMAAALFVWPFIFDAGVTFLRRLARGENVVKAHRSHLYQRLVATGLSHRQVSLTYLALGTLGLPAGVCAVAGSPAMAVIPGAVVAAASGVLWWTVVRREMAAATHDARSRPGGGQVVRDLRGSRGGGR